MNEWISVKDRLPNNRLFIGYCPDTGIHCFKNDEDQCITGGWESCPYCGGQSIGVIPGQEEPSDDKKVITHWMPLPEPPK